MADQAKTEGSSSFRGADSEHQQQLYAKIVTAARSAEPYLVQVRDDTGTPVNWIHPEIVDKCNLNREQCDPMPFKDFQNGRFECRERVHVRWAGKDNRTRDGVFFVAPKGSDVVLVLGDRYVRDHGRAEKVCIAKTIQGARPFVQSSLTKEEKEQISRREKQHNQDVAIVQKRRESRSSSRRSGTSSHKGKKGGKQSQPKA